MGIGFRCFIFEKDAALRRIPTRKLDRVFRGEECLPEYAGEKVRYAQILVALENQKPVDIIRSDCSFIILDADGRIVESEIQRAIFLAGSMMEPIFLSPDDNVVDMTPDISKRIFREEFIWTPTDAEMNAIEEAIF